MVPALFGSNGAIGGAERYAMELARHMSSAAPTTLMSFGTRAESWREGDLQIHILGHVKHVRRQWFNPLSHEMLGPLRHADIVHCHQRNIMATSVAALFCRATGRKVFVSDLGGGGFDASAFVPTDHWFHGHLHISNFSRQVSEHPQRARAEVIYGGVDINKFSPLASETSWVDRPVLFVGRLLPHKGVDYLIEALPVGMTLKIIGPALDAEYLNELHRLAAGKNVSFHHTCDDEEVISAYRRALCIVLPSVFEPRFGPSTRVPELLGQTLLEGMACGVPAVCTKVASLPEIVESGVHGFVVKPNDAAELRSALVRLRDNPEETKRMGSAARRRVLDRFTWMAVVNRCLECYARA